MQAQFRIAVLIGMAVMAGCSAPGSPAGPPSVSGGNASVDPGGRATLNISARNVARLRIDLPDTDALSLLGFEEAVIRPAPDVVLESLPPVWVWDPPVSEVTVRLPVEPPADSAPGVYRFTVRGTAPSGERVVEATVRVRVVSANSSAG